MTPERLADIQAALEQAHAFGFWVDPPESWRGRSGISILEAIEAEIVNASEQRALDLWREGAKGKLTGAALAPYRGTAFIEMMQSRPGLYEAYLEAHYCSGIGFRWFCGELERRNRRGGSNG